MLIASAAYYQVCEKCKRHARIVFADGTFSKPVVSLRGAIGLMKKSLAEGRLTDVEIPELERTVRMYHHPGDEKDDGKIDKFFEEHPEVSFTEFENILHDPLGALAQVLKPDSIPDDRISGESIEQLIDRLERSGKTRLPTTTKHTLKK